MEEIEIYGDGPYTKLIYQVINYGFQFVHQLVTNSPHLEDCNTGIEALKSMMQLDDAQSVDAKTREALYHFNKIDDSDKLYVKCISWYFKACCYAILKQWDDSYMMIDYIDKIETNLFTVNKPVVNDIKQKLPGLLYSVRSDEVQILNVCLNSTKTELENTKTELENTKTELESTKNELENARKELKVAIEELNKTNEELAKTRKELTNNKGTSPNTLPIWVIITTGILTITVTVLVSYIIFKS